MDLFESNRLRHLAGLPVLAEAKVANPERMSVERLYHHILDNVIGDDKKKQKAFNDALIGYHIERRSDHAEAKEIMLDFLDKA